jgi:hypothetical protein
MNRWVSFLLLFSFVRLQFACCCGSVVHWELEHDQSKQNHHSLSASRVDSAKNSCSCHPKKPKSLDSCIDQSHQSSEGDDDGLPHQHHLQILHSAMVGSCYVTLECSSAGASLSTRMNDSCCSAKSNLCGNRRATLGILPQADLIHMYGHLRI